MTGRAPVYLGLGANLGDREANLRQAIDRLRERVAIDRVSSIYETSPVGYTEQPDFLNAACRGRTGLSPQELLAFVKEIERAMGRVERFRNAPRPIDIDILLYDALILDEPGLAIPHPRMHERAFVLAPMAEIAPRARHPVVGKTMARLLREVGRAGMRRLPGETPHPNLFPQGKKGSGGRSQPFLGAVGVGAQHAALLSGSPSPSQMERGLGGEAGPTWTELSATVSPELVEPLTELFTKQGKAPVVLEERQGAITLRAYVPNTPAGRRRRARVDAGLALLGLILRMPELRERQTSEAAVAEGLKQHFTLLRVGRRLVVRPLWQEYEPVGDEVVIALDPGASFGTGHHPTTRMCLEALERWVRPGWRVLDVGTGSGVLAIAAARLGAGDVVGVDTNAVAVRTARRNVRANRLGRRVTVMKGSLPAEGVQGFDVVVANLVAHLIKALAPALYQAMAPGGVLIASGVLKEQRVSVLARLQASGFRLKDACEDGDWLALMLGD